MITLRQDQEDVRGKLRVALRSSSSVLCFAPTGFGKTVLAAALIQALFKAGKRVIFAVHRVNLIKQTAETFKKFGIPFSYIANGMHYNPLHRVYIASIMSLRKRMHRIKADYIFNDEAHLSAAKGWAEVSKHYKDQGAKQIGLTGSPERLDGKPLGDVWDELILGPSVRWLIEQGHLSRYRAFAPKMVDTSGLKKSGGDFNEKQVDALMEGKAVMSDAVRHWRKYADGLRTIAFCPSIARSEEYAAEFTAQGIPSVSMDADTPQGERERAFNDFADGKIKVIFNCDLFAEGFDLAAQIGRDITIECCMQLRPTASLAKHLQQLGRALRKKNYPAVLLDLVGNIARLGLPDDEHEWSLEGRKNKQAVRVVTCPECMATYHAGEPWTCGHTPVKKVAAAGAGRRMDEVDHELEEIDIEAARKVRQREEKEAKTIEQLTALAIERGYKNPESWAAHRFTERAAAQKKAIAASYAKRDAERAAVSPERERELLARLNMAPSGISPAAYAERNFDQAMKALIAKGLAFDKGGHWVISPAGKYAAGVAG